MTGQTISHYRILDKLGEGGMGVVYKAEDTKLKRTVALKFLPPDALGDPDLRTRFLQEAQAAAALSYPNVCTVYEIDEDRGFLAMEFVEGETAQARARRRPLPIPEALDIAIQAAQGLQTAHERGVVHRDIKSANLMVTPQGAVKIMDFGLARLTGRTRVTRTGTALGTPAYMSPEQAQGKAVDRRTDLWSLGVVLYEMVAGQLPFRGDGEAAVVHAILHTEPEPVTGLRAGLPLDLDRVIGKALAKDPGERYQHSEDLLVDLRRLRSQVESGSGRTTVIPAGIRRRELAAWSVAALAAGGAVASWFAGRRRPPASVGVFRYTIALPAGTQLTRDVRGPSRTEVAVSPDGRQVVFSASPDGSEAQARLYLRAMDAAEAAPIAGTEDARMPFFSPDGQRLGFYARGKLQTVAPGGGITMELCVVESLPMGASWGANGRIVIGTGSSGLQSVDAEGGKLQNLTTINPATEVSHRLPNFLPGGKTLVFTAIPQFFGARGRIESLSLESGERKVLVEDGTDARYVPGGHLVYLREGILSAVPIDPGRTELRGAAVPVVEGLQHAVNDTHGSRNSRAGQYSFSNAGGLVYASGGVVPDIERELLWVDRRGRAEPLKSFGKRAFIQPRLSPDGQKVAYGTIGRNQHLWVYDLVRGTSRRLTSTGSAMNACWTPDGGRVVFGYSGAGPENIFWMPWDGSGAMERLTVSGIRQNPSSFSPDGRWLAIVETRSASMHEILLLSMDSRQLSPLRKANQNDEQWPMFSPDGRWLAYGSNESGRFEIYVTPVPGPGGRIPISGEGGREPLWAADGHELFYWTPDTAKLMAVEIVAQPDFQAGSPRVLFEFQYSGAQPARNYDVARDGRRFLIPGPVSTKPAEVTQLNVVVNWFEELKRLVPSGR